MTCKAKQYSDQMLCGRCGLAWDVNDIDPPECRTKEWYEKQRAELEVKKMKEILECTT